MANNALVLLANNFKSWVSARGFIMVVAAALVPLLLTGAWVGTHQTDVAATDLSWSPNPPTEGDPVNISATIVNKGHFDVGTFNATLTVGRVSQTAGGVRLITDTTNTTVIHGLKSGASQRINMTWTARTGFFVVLADADSGDKIPEIEEFNNQKPLWLEVRYKIPNATEAPKAPGNLTGPASASGSADVAITGIDWTPADVRPNDNVTITANITNNGPDAVDAVNVTLQAGQVFSNQIFASRDQKIDVALAPGETKQVTLHWVQVPPGPYWVEAFANVTTMRDPNGANNEQSKPFIVHIRVGDDAKFPEPPEKLTIKRFYLDILNYLHIRVLLPLIGLFYAAGVLADDREKGNLVYILTRPVSRPLIPIVKFVASFLVASVAVIVGILGTFFLLLGTPQGNVGFLVTPLLISLISLFVYGSFFILLGVLFERPYLIGLGWVIGWETIAGNFVPWVKNLTLSNHLLRAIDGWRLDQGVQWLPADMKARNELWIVLGAALVFLIASVVIMRRREFDV